MFKEQIIEILSEYLDKKIVRDEMCDQLDRMSVEIAKNYCQLRIEDIFLSHLIPHITTIPEQAYSDVELGQIIEALQGTIPISFAGFIRVLPEILNDDEKQMIRIVRRYTDENAPNDARNYLTLESQDKEMLNHMWRRYQGKRMELYGFSTVTEWLLYQVMRLLRIGCNERALKGMGKGLTVEEIKEKMRRYVNILEGKENSYIVTDGKMISMV